MLKTTHTKNRNPVEVKHLCRLKMIKCSLCFVLGSLFMLAAIQDNVWMMFDSILLCICILCLDRDRQGLKLLETISYYASAELLKMRSSF